MTAEEITRTRTKLKLTQTQLASLLGVHVITVSKWERGVLRPTPHQQALLRAALNAANKSPDIGDTIVAALVGTGVAIALYLLLEAAFGGSDRELCLHCEHGGKAWYCRPCPSPNAPASPSLRNPPPPPAWRPPRRPPPRRR